VRAWLQLDRFSVYTEVVEYQYRLGDVDSQFWGRQVAKAPRRRLQSLLERSVAGDVVVLDAARVEGFDFSFAAELLVPLLTALPKAYAGRFLVVEHLNDVTRENLAIALELNDLAMIERRRDGLRLIGKVGPADRETFELLVRSRSTVSAPEVAGTLGIALTTTNERLVKLVKLGLARRDDADAQGRAFRYAVPS
jgi:hypothetical protein